MKKKKMKRKRSVCQNTNKRIKYSFFRKKPKDKIQVFKDKIFPLLKKQDEDFFKRSNFFKIKKFLISLGFEKLREFCETIFEMDEFPKHLNRIADVLTYRLFGEPDSYQKRMFEIEELKKYSPTKFFNLCKIVIPRELMMIILRYMKKNRTFLNSFGLVCHNWYILALETWKVIKIRQRNIYFIPVLALRSAKYVAFNVKKEVLIPDIKYIQENIHSAQYLIIEDCVGKFFKFLGIMLPNIIILDIRGCVKTLKLWRVSNLKKLLIRDTFPKLENITQLTNLTVFGLFNTKNVDPSCLDYMTKNLKKLTLGTIGETKACLSKLKNLKNLRELHISISEKEHMSFLKNMKNMQVLDIKLVGYVCDMRVLNEFILDIVSLRKLKSLFITYKLLDRIESLDCAPLIHYLSLLDTLNIIRISIDHINYKDKLISYVNLQLFQNLKGYEVKKYSPVCILLKKTM